jgi:hypothetical protein
MNKAKRAAMIGNPITGLFVISPNWRWQRIVLWPPDKGAASEASGGFLTPRPLATPLIRGASYFK